MSDLKPCPFCGESVCILATNRGAFVKCKICRTEVKFPVLEMRYNMGLSQSTEANRRDVEDMWNRRAKDD